MRLEINYLNKKQNNLKSQILKIHKNTFLDSKISIY